MRWKFMLLFYFKQIFKSKLYIGASILFIGLLISRFILFFSDPYDMEQYGQLPSEVLMIVQMVSLFYMIFFYRIHSNEMLYGVQSFFVDGYRIMLEKISAMFAAHIICMGILLVTTYGMFTLIYLSVGIEPSTFYLSLFRFLLNYMFAPLIFSMLFGIVVAMLFGIKKISFFAILLLWIATGSIVAELFYPFFSTIYANEWRSLLFIGLEFVQHVYDSYIGFYVYWGNELKIITWFLITMGIILTLSLRWTLRTKERNLVIKILIGMLILALFTAYGVVEISTKAFSRADNLAEDDYYKKTVEVETDLRYEIKSYKIQIEDKQATVSVKFSQLDTNKPTFQLYHAYPVKWIKADGERVKFERSGDIVKVRLPVSTSSLTFHYEIVDTNYIPYTNGRITLLADKAWYPKKKASHNYEIDEYKGYINPTERFISDESYFFTFEGEEGLFCNLPRQGGVYSGKAQAVTYIKGQGNQLTYGDYYIIYPADWSKMEERTPKVLTQLEKTLFEIQQIAPTTIQSLPRSIVFSNYGLSSLVTKDHLVYNTNYGDGVDSYETTKDFQENMLQLVVQRKGPTKLHREWVNMVSQMIRERYEWKIELKERSVDSFDFPQIEQEKIESIYNQFYLLNPKQQQLFLREWYKKMDETWTWDQVLGLVKEWR